MSKFCPKCGKQLDDNAVFCDACGNNLQAQPAQQPVIVNVENTNTNVNAPSGKAKNKWVALILCFFFGCLGIHRFYEGKIGTGILWFLTLGLFGIGAFIDFFIILFKPTTYYV
ncbi:MAG: NINE protein [Christensenellaceae bacterium]